MALNNQIVGTNSTWTTSSNWTSGTPSAGQYVFLSNLAGGSFTGSLNQSSVVLGLMNQDMSFTSTIGTNGSTNTYLQYAGPLFNLGLPTTGSTASGSRTFNLDVGTSNSVVNVVNTASSGVVGAPVKLLGTNATVNLTNGIISIAAAPAESATILTFNVTNGGGQTPPSAYLGPGCTINTLNQNNAGAITIAAESVVTSSLLTGASSQLTYIGSGGFNSLTVANSAKLTHSGSGSINSMTLGGTLDCSSGGSSVTIGACTLTLNTRILDPLRRLIFTTPPVLSLVSLKDIYIDRGIGGTF